MVVQTDFTFVHSGFFFFTILGSPFFTSTRSRVKKETCFTDNTHIVGPEGLAIGVSTFTDTFFIFHNKAISTCGTFISIRVELVTIEA
jgi:hypothetical protein